VDGDAAGDGEAEAAVEGLELGAVGDVAAFSVGALPHAASNVRVTMGTQRLTRFFIAIFEGLRSSH
jgi:hypothetical protein